MVDASPLIYLAKLDALEVFAKGGYQPIVPEAVVEETTRPALIYRHPDAATIEAAVGRGDLRVVVLAPAEEEIAARLAVQVPGMHPGECHVLSVALARGTPAVMFERRGRSVARAYGVELVDVFELLFDGTPDDGLLDRRVRRFAELIEMRLADLEALRERIARRRLP